MPLQKLLPHLEMLTVQIHLVIFHLFLKMIQCHHFCDAFWFSKVESITPSLLWSTNLHQLFIVHNQESKIANVNSGKLFNLSRPHFFHLK